MDTKIISIFGKEPKKLTAKEIEIDKKGLLNILNEMVELVEKGEVMSIGIATNYYNGATGNSFYIGANPVTLIGELDCLKLRIQLCETDTNNGV